MNLAQKGQIRFAKISEAVIRFWFSTAAALFTTICLIISVDADFLEAEVISFVLAGLLGIVAQLLYERFFKNKPTIRWGLYGGAALLTLASYFYLKQTDITQYQTALRIGVIFFVLVVGSIWVPTIQEEEYAFSRSLLIFVKSFFTAFLLSLVLMLGLLIVLGAFSALIQMINVRIFAYVAIFSWATFMPIYFFSLLPVYPNMQMPMVVEDGQQETYQQAIKIPKFFRVLLTYIIIPIIIAYTGILILYMLINITGDFWNNSLLDGLIVGFLISGWITLFLVDTLETRLPQLFKQIFPFILLVMTTIQGIATISKIVRFGLTDGYYYTLLYVIFSIFASIIYLFKHKKVWLVPAILIALSLVSILPYIDAVSLSTSSQMQAFVNTLEKTICSLKAKSFQLLI